MDEEIRLFTGYLEEIKKLSRNTVMSYHGDLTKMAVYMKEQGITSTADIRGTTLNAYVLHMEKNGMSAATISRYIASMKAFFEYLVRERILDEDPSFFLKPPKVEKKLPGILTVEEMEMIRKADKNCRLIKGQVFLWPGATDWQDLWDVDGEITS